MEIFSVEICKNSTNLLFRVCTCASLQLISNGNLYSKLIGSLDLLHTPN